MERKIKDAAGQGIVEYILITALVALGMVAVFRTFKADLTKAYKTAGEALINGVQDSVSSDAPTQ